MTAAPGGPVRRCGDRALLVETADPAGLAAALRALGLPDVVEVVPAAATVLVRHGAAADLAALTRLVTSTEPLPSAAVGGEAVIDVVYDGDDLHGVADLAGMSPEAVVALHQEPAYEVAFCGFAPGFAYLRGLDARLVVPRLATPRTRVPAGSVAVADVWSAVYPRESPGGWRLLGRTSAVLWDAGRDDPALLAPGTRVRFREVPR